MKAVVLNGQSVEYQELPLSPLPKAWATVRVAVAGLCGTDVAKFTGSVLPANHTRILGHEFIGQVTEVNGSAGNVAAGDWVVCLPLVACGACDACRGKRENLCLKAEAIGRTFQGAFAEYVNVPLNNLFKVSARPHKALVLADPVAVCLHAFGLIARGLAKSSCLVIGDGTIGCLLAWLLQMHGQAVSIKGVHPQNLEFVKQFGIQVLTGEVPQRAYDEVYESVGRAQSRTLDESLHAVRAGGSVVVLGVYSPGYDYSLAARELFIKEALVVGANAYTRKEFESALHLIEHHKALLGLFLTHSFPMWQFAKALETARNKTGITMKVVLEAGGPGYD